VAILKPKQLQPEAEMALRIAKGAIREMNAFTICALIKLLADELTNRGAAFVKEKAKAFRRKKYISNWS